MRATERDALNKTAPGRGFSRREVVSALGATAVVTIAGGGLGQARGGDNNMPGAPACVVRPRQTEGPYFIDEKFNRFDIRSDPADGIAVAGAPLRVAFRVSRVNGGSCAPLAGAIVDLWHCDAQGVYSDVKDQDGRFDTRGKSFLRGHQVTDAHGNAGFLTIYPGWYEGRTVHLHFKIRTDPASRRGYAFTSQIYFDEAVSDEVFKLAPYAGKGASTTKNARDGIFRRGGKDLMLRLEKSAQGYSGTFEIGLKIG